MWFSASLLFKSTHSTKNGAEPLWEDRIILIEATDAAEAKGKAKELGLSEEHGFKVSETDSVKWMFDSVERVYEVDGEKFFQGLEIFSRFLRDSEVANLKKPFTNGE